VAGAGFVGLAIAISAQQMVSRDWRRVLLGVEVARGADLGLVTRTVEQAAQEFHQDEQWRPWLLDEPEIWGVEGLGPASATIRLGLKTRPSKRDEVARELRARVDETLERAAIPLPSDTDHP
jgi:moderate conductance mechanosensitive channel